MKKTVLTLAAVLVFSGAAIAGSSQPAKQAPAAACIHTNANVKLDCVATGSVEKVGGATKTGPVDRKGPKLGIDINPWIVPSTF
ncbi:conserved exported hypothetical protein [Mesorhizobium metallidurans STM 2683]|uniref:DUF680 domain-containing protein n=1 Tax=Mesorhizobium metallidurans STM 2683 TaxID=1297569 RepID=M5F0V5_9HYPH|nr:DUF680 domain-containing protein [Mesorhizobium metallidurans]CCV05446.1 conserved exported hypothetical protein [Mesorhizobium metallidurans STM 2683]